MLNKSLAETNQSLVNRIINEIGQRMIENAINATINMTTRDTKDGIADVIIELLSANRRVNSKMASSFNQRNFVLLSTLFYFLFLF